MGEFKDGSLWQKLAFLLTCMGFLLLLFAFASGLGGWGNGREAEEAMLVLCFLCYITAITLILCITFLDELAGNKIAAFCYIIFSLAAGIFLIIGIAVYGGKSNKGTQTYATLIGVFAAIEILLSAIFSIIAMLGGVKIGGGSGGNDAKA